MKHDFINIDRNGKSWNRSNISSNIARMIASPSGKAKLAAAMIQPLRTNIDYNGLARKMFSVEQLPEGALPIYDIDVSSIVLENFNYKHNDIRISRSGNVSTPESRKRSFGVRRVTILQFEIFSNPSVKLSDVKYRRFDMIERNSSNFKI